MRTSYTNAAGRHDPLPANLKPSLLTFPDTTARTPRPSGERTFLNAARASAVLAAFFIVAFAAPPAFGQCSPTSTTENCLERTLPALPAGGGKFTDPDFGTQVMRLTDAADAPACGTPYSYWPAFNRDATRILVQCSNGTHFYRFDPATFTRLERTTYAAPPGFLPMDFANGYYWSKTNPNLVYAFASVDTRLYSYDVSTGQQAVVRDFAAHIGAGRYVIQPSMSDDLSVIGFTVKNGVGYTNHGYMVYNLSTSAVLLNVADVRINEVHVSKDGQYASVDLDGPQAVRVWNLSNTSNSQYLPFYDPSQPQNEGLGHNTTKSNYIVGFTGALTYTVSRWEFTNLQRTTLLTFNTVHTGTSHISGLMDDDNWALVSISDGQPVTPSAGYGATATTIQLEPGHGPRVPDNAQFDAVWWNQTDYPRGPGSDPGSEIIRVTSRSGDTLTVLRGQQGTAATPKNTPGKSYRILPTGPFHGEIFLVKTDGSGQVRRFVHHRAQLAGYYDSNFGNISRDGSYVAFASNWDYSRNPDSSVRTDLFIARLTPPGDQPVVSFSQSTYSASETGADPTTEPVAVITVARTGNLSGTSTVEYQTNDDPAAVPCDPSLGSQPAQPTAYARCDYATTGDTLTFAPGESQKTFRIPLVNDSHVEQPETFTVVLSTPSGATLGAQSSATVTINSDDTGGGANPVNDHLFFVRQQYLDFLSREPDFGGFYGWVNQLNNCPNPYNPDPNPNSPSAYCDRITVSSGFFRSGEFEIKGLYVYKFYRVAFHHPPSSLPTYSVISRDMRSVAGQTAQEVYAKRAAYANAFVQRPAFRGVYDSLSNAAYVAALLNPYSLSYITTTDPASPDTGGTVVLTQADLIARLDNLTLTRAQVLRAVVQSQEAGAAEFNGAFVAMQYYGYLRRTPEETGYNNWLAYLNANPTNFRTMVHGFLYSTEYMLRFGPLSSSNLALGRPAAQSSEAWGGVPGRAVDGNTSGDWNAGSVTHTTTENQAWWQTDLGGVSTIASVQLWNRTDCCSERLANFYVLVSDAPFNSTDLQTTLNQPGVSAYPTAGQGGSPTTVVVNRTGRYVRVQLAGTNVLSLAEVKVWGR